MIVVISDNAFFSDMYSTAFFTMPVDEILDYSDKNNLGVLIVDKDMKIYKSSKMNIELK